ncbi:MAG: hypothetical protein NC089_10215 [Bacteroides sp.]|nr:hypothetical protein [Bacteroides sp.]MCM1550335.1 hypothetical protein [Clostridium sp.]
MIQNVKYNDKKGCVSLDVIITEDNTDYGDETVSNIFEKFKVHLIKDIDEDDIGKYHVRDKIILRILENALYGVTTVHSFPLKQLSRWWSKWLSVNESITVILCSV